MDQNSHSLLNLIIMISTITTKANLIMHAIYSAQEDSKSKLQSTDINSTKEH